VQFSFSPSEKKIIVYSAHMVEFKPRFVQDSSIPRTYVEGFPNRKQPFRNNKKSASQILWPLRLAKIILRSNGENCGECSTGKNSKNIFVLLKLFQWHIKFSGLNK
jgi:hypothetical protein